MKLGLSVKLTDDGLNYLEQHQGLQEQGYERGWF